MSLSLLTAFVALAMTCLLPQQTAEACSIVSDYASPPDQEQPYDPENAPNAPIIVDSYISHDLADNGPGCAGVSSCGDIHGLHLVVTGVEESHILRITHEDGSTIFASRGYSDGDGNLQIFLPGYADVDADMPFRLATIDREGYPSLDVEAEAINEVDNDPSCSAGGSSTSSLATSLFALFFLMICSRRRRTT